MKIPRKALTWLYIVFTTISLLQIMGCETEEHEERESRMEERWR